MIEHHLPHVEPDTKLPITEVTGPWIDADVILLVFLIGFFALYIILVVLDALLEQPTQNDEESRGYQGRW